MSRIAYVNGRYLPLAQACVNVEDRGYQFSDGVYEVCEVRGGRLVDERRHIGILRTEGTRDHGADVRHSHRLRWSVPCVPVELVP